MTIATPPSASWLDDGLTLFAPTGGGIQIAYGRVAGAARVVDTGSATAAWHGVVAFEPDVLEGATVTDTCDMVIEGCADAGFTGATQELARWHMKKQNLQDVTALSNVHDATVFRYVRLKIEISGAVQVRAKAFMKPLSDLDDYTLAELITLQATLAQNIHNANTHFRAWMTGTAFGGPEHDGRYLLSDGLGNAVLVKCPARIAADAGVGGDPYAEANIDTRGGNEGALDDAYEAAKAQKMPLTGTAGTVTIANPKVLTGCSIHLPYKTIVFGTNFGSGLPVTTYLNGDEGAPVVTPVAGPAIDLGGVTPEGETFAKTLRIDGGYAGNGVNQATPFTAVRIQTDQSARSTYDIGVQRHRGDGLEINSDTEKKVINYLFDHIYEGYALTFRTIPPVDPQVPIPSPDEVVVNCSGTWCSNLLHAQESGQFSYRVNFNVEAVLPWIGTYAIDDCSRKGSCYAGEIRGPVGDLIRVETRQDGATSGGANVVFDSLRIIQHYNGRISIINPKSVGGTIYHDQVDNSRPNGTSTTRYRNSLSATAQLTYLVDQPAFQIGAVLENCTLTYVTRRNTCPYGARIGISDWEGATVIDSETEKPAQLASGSAFSGKSIRLEVEMGDRSAAVKTVTATFATVTATAEIITPTVTGSFSGTTFTQETGASLSVGQALYGLGVPKGMTITAVLQNTILPYLYTVSLPLNLASGPVALGSILNVTGIAAFGVDQFIEGDGIPTGTRITANLGGNQYAINRLLTLSSRTVSGASTCTLATGQPLANGQFLKGAGLPVGLRVVRVTGSGNSAVYQLNRVVTPGARAVSAGASADMFYAVWADYGTGSTIWADGNLQGNILISQGWQRGTIHVSAAWVRAGYTVRKDAAATTEFIIHGPITLAELRSVGWAFEGVKALEVTDFGGLSVRHDGAHWVFSRVIDVPRVSIAALGSGLNAADVKRLGLSVIDRATATIFVAQGPGMADPWLSTAGETVTPDYLPETAAFDQRQVDEGGTALMPPAKLVYDRLFHDLIFAGVYTPDAVNAIDASMSLLKGVYLLNGPNESAARVNLLFNFWTLGKTGGANLKHTPAVGFEPQGTNTGSYLEVTGFAANRNGVTRGNIALGACAEGLYTSKDQTLKSNPFTLGSDKAYVRTVFHRLDGGNNVVLNADRGVNTATYQLGSYRLGMGYTHADTTQNIMMHGGALAEGRKALPVVEDEDEDIQALYAFRAQDKYLSLPLSMMLVGQGGGWTAKKAEATLAALNLARAGLRAL